MTIWYGIDINGDPREFVGTAEDLRRTLTAFAVFHRDRRDWTFTRRDTVPSVDGGRVRVRTTARFVFDEKSGEYRPMVVFGSQMKVAS